MSNNPDTTIGYYKLLHDFKQYRNDSNYYNYWFVRLFDKFVSTINIEGIDAEAFRQEDGELASLWNFWLLATSNPTFAITKSPKGNYIFVTGGRSGNVMYSTQPEEYTFAVPDYSGVKKINKDIWVGSLLTSQLPYTCIFDYYASLLAEVTKSLKVGILNTRLSKIFNATSDKEKASIENALDKIYEGKPLVFNNDDILAQLTDGAGVQMFDLVTNNSKDILTTILLTQEEIYADFCRTIGVDVQNKSKQAQVQEAELKGMETDALLSIENVIFNLNRLFTQFEASTGIHLEASKNEHIENAEAETEVETDAETEVETEDETEAGTEDETDDKKGGETND